jgi:hypothetical protein
MAKQQFNFIASPLYSSKTSKHYTKTTQVNAGGDNEAQGGASAALWDIDTIYFFISL